MTIPNSVTSVGLSSFYGCSNLTSLTIPDSVTSIGQGAFRYCTGLTNVTIGNGVTNIGSDAFDNCSGLTNVTFQGKTLEQVQAMSDYSWGISDTSIINVA